MCPLALPRLVLLLLFLTDVNLTSLIDSISEEASQVSNALVNVGSIGAVQVLLAQARYLSKRAFRIRDFLCDVIVAPAFTGLPCSDLSKRAFGVDQRTRNGVKISVPDPEGAFVPIFAKLDFGTIKQEHYARLRRVLRPVVCPHREHFLAERQGSAAGYRQRPFDFKVEVVNVMTLSTRDG